MSSAASLVVVRSPMTVTQALALVSSTSPPCSRASPSSLHDVEPAAGDHHAAVALALVADPGSMKATMWSMSCSMSMPVSFSNSCLPVLVVGHRGAQLLAELGVHHVPDVA